MSFQPLDRVVWSVVGSGGEGGMKELPPVLDLAKKFPNITGVYLDDFIIGGKKLADGRTVGRPALQRGEMKKAREQMKAVGRPMEVWVTLYTHEINPARKTAAPGYKECEPPLASFLDQFDVLTLWTWNSEEIPELEENLVALEKIAPKKARIALGLYIWDFHNRKPVPVELMKHQCDLGLKWLKEGRISDMIFLANTVLDVGMPSAEFSRAVDQEARGRETEPISEGNNHETHPHPPHRPAARAAGRAARRRASSLLDAPSWKPSTTAVPEARRPAAFEVRKEEGLRFSLSGEVAQSKLMRWERPWTEGELAPEQFIVLEYRAWWLAQQRPYTDVIALYSHRRGGQEHHDVAGHDAGPHLRWSMASGAAEAAPIRRSQRHCVWCWNRPTRRRGWRFADWSGYLPSKRRAQL